MRAIVLLAALLTTIPVASACPPLAASCAALDAHDPRPDAEAHLEVDNDGRVNVTAGAGAWGIAAEQSCPLFPATATG